MNRVKIALMSLPCLVSILGIVSGCSDAKSNAFSDQIAILAREDKNQEIVALCEKNLQEKPDNSNVLADLGAAQLRLNNVNQAEQNLTKAISLDPKIGWYYRELGNVFSKLGDYKKALLNYDESLRLDPSTHNAAEVHNSRASMYLIMREFYKAFLDASEAIKLEPEKKYAYCVRAEACADLGEFTKGLADANKALSIDNKYFPAIAAKTKLYLSNGNLKEVITYAEEALKLDEKYWRASEYLGVANAINGNSAEALKVTDKLIEQFPDAAIGYADKAAFLLIVDETEKAKLEAGKAAKAQTDDIRTLLISALVAARQGYEKECLRLLDKAEKQENGGTVALRHRAYSMLYLKKYQDAVKICDSIISKETENVKEVTANKPFSTGNAYRIRAEAYKQLKLDDLAKTSMDKALSRGYQVNSFTEKYLKLL